MARDRLVIALLTLFFVFSASAGTRAQGYGEETAPAGADSVFVYGGPGSLQGRFQTDTGLPDWQGWQTRDLTDNPYWQISTFNAQNLDPAPGNHAIWAGRTLEQQPTWESAPGYGDGVIDGLYWTQSVADSGVGTTVRLHFAFNHDTEPGNDFFSVAWDSAGTWHTLLLIDGNNRSPGGTFDNPVVFDQTVVYPPNSYGGLGGDEIRLRLRVESDGYGSDDSGGFDSDGAVQIDNIEVWIGGGLESAADFETEESTGGWFAHSGRASGDYGKILAGFDDQGLDPDRDNATPALTIVDDGTPPRNIPEAIPTSGTTSAWDYGFPGEWVVPLHEWPSVFAESPAIPWEPEIPLDPSYEQAIVRADVWGHRTYFRHIPYVEFYVRSYPDPSSGDWTGWSNVGGGTFVEDDPRWMTLTYPMGDFLVAAPESLQVGVTLGGQYIQLVNVQQYTPSPVLDNVSVARVRETIVSSPPSPPSAPDLVLHGGRPNPFNPRTEIRFEVARETRVTLDIFDTRGSRVRRLVEGMRPAGIQSVTWNGRDDHGAEVASGVYFVKLRAFGLVASSKLVLLR